MIANIITVSQVLFTWMPNLLEPPFFLTVPPSFQNLTLNLTAVPSSPITLPCATFPDPTLTFSWFFNGVSLSSGGALVLTEDGGLVLSSVQSSDEGTYTCSATNSLGTANGTVHLDVLGKQKLLS